MKKIISWKSSTAHKLALIANLLTEQFNIPMPVYIILVIYETCLLMKMPMAIPTVYDSNYATIQRSLSSLSYALYCLKTSIEATMAVVIAHLAVSLVMPLFVVGMLFHNCRKFSNIINALAKVVIIVGVIEYTFMLLPMGKTFWAVMLQFSQFHLSNGFKILCGIGYAGTIATAFIMPILFCQNPNSKSIWAGSITFLHYGRTLIKVMLTLYMALDYELKYSWIAIVVFIIPVMWYLIQSATTNMFYQDSMYFIYTFQITLLLLSMLLLEIKTVLSLICTAEDLLNIIVLTSLISILLTLIRKAKSAKHLYLHVDKIELQKEAEEYAVALIRVIGSPNFEISSMIIFEINYKHLDIRQDEVRNIRELMHNKSFSDNIIKRIEIFPLFNSIYSKLITVFPQSTLLRLIYSIFLWEYSCSLYKSYFTVIKCLKNQSNIYFTIIALRLLNVLGNQQRNVYNKDIIEINKTVKYDKSIHMLRNLCQQTANYFSSIYKLLMHNNVNPQLLQAKVIATAKKLNGIKKIYEDITSISFHMPSYNLLYCFYKYILLNSEFLLKYRRMNKDKASIGIDNFTIYDYNSDSAILVVSGNEDDLERILYASNESSSIFQYTPKELVKQSITLIMPPLFRECHHNFINAFHETGVVKIMHTNRLLFGFTMECILMPIDAYIITLINLAATVQYIAYIKKKNSQSILQEFNFPSNMQSSHPLIWMLKLDGEIIGMNDYSYEVLRIPKKYIEIKKGILNVNANLLLPGINDLLNRPSAFQQGTMLMLDTRNLYSILDADVLQELKITLNKAAQEISLYVKPTKYKFSYIEYYVLVMCLSAKRPVSRRNETNVKCIRNSSNSLKSVYQSTKLPIDNKNRYLKNDKVQIAIAILIVLGALALNAFYLNYNTSVSTIIKWETETVSAQSKSGIFLLNLISIFQKYIMSVKSNSTTNVQYLNQLMLKYSSYLEQNTKILKHKPDISEHYYGANQNTNVTMYSMLLDIYEKLSYVINICEPSSLSDVQLNYIAESQISNIRFLPYCVRLTYEVIINSYHHFIIADNMINTSFSAITTNINLLNKGFYKSFVITIGLLLLCAMILIILSLRIRKFKTNLYCKLLELSKSDITERILMINRFQSICNDNTEIASEVKKISKESSKKENVDINYSALIERKKFTVPPSKIEFVTITTIFTLVGALVVMLLLYLHTTDKFESSLNISNLYICFRTDIIEASYLYFLSCFHSSPIYTTSDRSVEKIIDEAQTEFRNIKPLKAYVTYKNVFETGICDILINKNSEYYMPYVNETECETVYYNVLNRSVSDVIEIYITNLEEGYYSLLVEGSCKMDAQYEELYYVFTRYLNPVILAQISWANKTLMSKEDVFITMIWSYNTSLLLVTAFITSLIAFILRDIQTTTESIKKVLKQITTQN